jgi:hypothetical protein
MLEFKTTMWPGCSVADQNMSNILLHKHAFMLEASWIAVGLWHRPALQMESHEKLSCTLWALQYWVGTRDVMVSSRFTIGVPLKSLNLSTVKKGYLRCQSQLLSDFFLPIPEFAFKKWILQTNLTRPLFRLLPQCHTCSIFTHISLSPFAWQLHPTLCHTFQKININKFCIYSFI